MTGGTGRGLGLHVFFADAGAQDGPGGGVEGALRSGFMTEVVDQGVRADPFW